MMQRVRISAQQFPVHKLGDSEMTLTPKFRIASMDSSLQDPSLDTELALRGEPLIPGLPDDVALNCLLRAPVESHEACRAVCKRWYLLFGNKERFFSRRKELSFHDPWVFVFAFDKCTGKIEWKVFDLVNLSWHAIPAMPCTVKVCPHGFSAEQSLDRDEKYDYPEVIFCEWTINGMVYVAGGNSTDLFELGSAEVLDPNNGTWRPIANMKTNMASYDAAVLDGKLLVTEGWFWPFYVGPRGQVYDPRTDSWESMASGLREGWTGSSVVIDENLFVVPEHERTTVKVYDKETDTWNKVNGPPLPQQICKPFCVNCCSNKIIVVGRNLHVAVGLITRQQRGGEESPRKGFCVEWQVVDAPQSLCHLMPSSAQLKLSASLKSIRTTVWRKEQKKVHQAVKMYIRKYKAKQIKGHNDPMNFATSSASHCICLGRANFFPALHAILPARLKKINQEGITFRIELLLYMVTQSRARNSDETIPLHASGCFKNIALMADLRVAQGRGRDRNRKRGHGKYRGYNPGSGQNRRGGYNFKNKNYHRKWESSGAKHDKDKRENYPKRIESVCYRCGMTGHWERVCHTSKHFVDLYQASLKGKANIESNNVFMEDDFVGTQLDVEDYLGPVENLN
nr:F-box/kelch-repeat protein At1g30090-like [Ipomoea batatas]